MSKEKSASKTHKEDKKDKKLSDKFYKKELAKLHIELVKLHRMG